jgi:hypothetical protein
MMAMGGFVAGVVFDHFAFGNRRATASTASSQASQPLGAVTDDENDLPTIGSTKAATKPAGSVSTASVIAAIKNALAVSSDRHGYIELSKLIDGLDPKEARAVIDAMQTLPNQRKKLMLISMLFSRWAEADPQAALGYAQTTGNISERTRMVSATVRSWAEKDGNAAHAWVLQLPPGLERERALHSVVSALSE